MDVEVIENSEAGWGGEGKGGVYVLVSGGKGRRNMRCYYISCHGMCAL